MNKDVKLYEKVVVNEMSRFMTKSDISDVISISRDRYEELLKMKRNRDNDFYIEEIFRSYTKNTELMNALLDFSQMRAEIKKPFKTKGAVTRLLNKLEKISKSDDEKIAILEKSIINNWQDIWELKEDEKVERKSYQRKDTINMLYEDKNRKKGDMEKRVLGKNKLGEYLEKLKEE